MGHELTPTANVLSPRLRGSMVRQLRGQCLPRMPVFASHLQTNALLADNGRDLEFAAQRLDVSAQGRHEVV